MLPQYNWFFAEKRATNGFPTFILLQEVLEMSSVFTDTQLRTV
jgi:hypothetical protein